VGFAKLPLGSRSLPSGKGAGSHWEVTRAVAASAAASKKALIRPALSHLPLRKFHGFAADALQDSRCRAARVCHDRGAGLSPCARNTIREAISRDTPSSQHAGHPVRRNCTHSAAGTFSGHRRRSRRTCHQRCGWPSLSGDERLVQRRVITHTPRLRRSYSKTIRTVYAICIRLCYISAHLLFEQHGHEGVGILRASSSFCCSLNLRCVVLVAKRSVRF
jgi:hypothetical protein